MSTTQKDSVSSVFGSGKLNFVFWFLSPSNGIYQTAFVDQEGKFG
jgi:hypothetical protein